MSRIDNAFARCQSEQRAAFMPYLVAGDPSLEATRRLIPAMAAAGADLIELGVPFSDPMADGPTNQRASERALAAGATLRGVLDCVREIRTHCEVPINLMGYYNPFFRYGIDAFFADAAEAGVDGVIIPDLQPDDVQEVRAAADRNGIATIFLIAPTSTEERLKLVARESRGFVYAVSLTGVTGERTGLPPHLQAMLDSARKQIQLPLAVGFGISTPEDARQIGSIADGVIIGSAIVRRIEQAHEDSTDPVEPVCAFVREIASALKQ